MPFTTRSLCNSVAQGGGTLTITGATISGNKAVNSGGGIFVYSGSLTLTDSTISANSAGVDGGGIFNYNPNDQTYSAGTTATTTVIGSTISNNQATNGGGIFNDDTLTLTNTTVAGNSASTGGGVDDAAAFTAESATIAYNTGSVGGGLYLGSGTATLYNTIVALNANSTRASDISTATGLSVSGSYNLIGTGGSGGLSAANHNQLGIGTANLDLGSLANNGGPTETIALLAGSFAIDTGGNSITGVTVPTIDQRGAQRGPAGLDAGIVVDIGAYEASSSYLVSTLTDSTGVGTLRAAIGWANFSSNANPAERTNPEPNTIIFAPDLSGQTITLSQGAIALTNTTLNEVIDAPGITISGGGVSGVFTVASGVNVTLEGGSATNPLTIEDGAAATDGGGIDNSGTLTLSFVNITGNSAVTGGGIANEAGATLSLTDSSLTGNTGSSSGGGLANLGTATLLYDTVSGNTAATGGGIFNASTGTITGITDTTLASNSANVGSGGGIDNSGTITIADSTLSANSAALAGGGIDDESGGSLTATNVTLANNSAVTGGGIATTGTVTLINATVAYNSVSSTGTGVGTGGGLAVATGGVDTLYNTIVADNTQGTPAKPSDIALAGTGIISPVSSFNLVGTGGAGNMVNGNNNNTILSGVAVPGLASGLANDGGPTETISLVAGSPAIDAGSASIAGVTVPVTDQRGALRGPAGLDAGAAPDIGAFEDSSSYLVTTTTSGPDVGTIETAVEWANKNININPANHTPSVANTIVFDSSGVFSTAQTITVTAPLVFDNTATPEAIDGSASTPLTLSGGNASGVLQIGSGANLSITALTISSGSATSGGAIDNDGTLAITDATITQSTATNGGAIDNQVGAALTIVSSTLSFNSATAGGAIDNAGTATLTNTTIADNRASTGGGIANSGALVIVSSTIADNSASTSGGGGGLNTTPGTAALYDTIVALNYSGATPALNDIEGNVILTATPSRAGSSNNLVDDANSAGGMTNHVNGNLVGFTPGFAGSANLANNGGPTETIALAAGSPAINSGASKILGVIVPLNDQRGAARASLNGGTTIDIGAYEISSSYLVTSTADTPTSGTLRTALAWANSTPASAVPGPITIDFDPTLFNASTPQTIALSTTFGTIDLTNTSGAIAIDGPGSDAVTITGDGVDSIFTVASGVTASLSGMTIAGGSAASGGAIMNLGNLTITADVLTGNSAVYYGGAIYNNGGVLAVSNSTFTNDLATYGVGGAIDNTGTLTVADSTFTGGAAFQGGAIDSSSGTLSVAYSTFMNDSGTEGGAIFNNAVATISSSTIADDNTSFDGGGIANDLNGNMTIVNSTIASNNAGQTGGGINSVGTLTVTNSTIAYNSVTAGGSGGGIDTSSGNVALNNTIVAQNTAGSGATAGFSDISGSINAASAYNLIGTGGAGGLVNGTNGNLVGVSNPGLATTKVTSGGTTTTSALLVNNGGPTVTIALMAGSPALNAGNNALAVDASGNPLLYDQRGAGFPRIVDLTVDIGAYERAPATTINHPIISEPRHRRRDGHVHRHGYRHVCESLNVPTGTVTFFERHERAGARSDDRQRHGIVLATSPALLVGTDIDYRGLQRRYHLRQQHLADVVARPSIRRARRLRRSTCDDLFRPARRRLHRQRRLRVDGRDYVQRS